MVPQLYELCRLPQHRGLSIARAASNQDKDEALPQEQPEKKNEAAQLDSNRLQTSLSRAVASEDYAQAAQIRDQLNSVSGSKDGKKQSPPAGWQGLGIPEWLADRVERLGFMMPTDIQRESSKLMMLGADVFLSAQTGSGKTLAFLIPVLAMLDYQPGACDFFISFDLLAAAALSNVSVTQNRLKEFCPVIDQWIITSALQDA